MKKIYRSLLVSLFAIFMLGTTSATTISGYMLYLNNPELPIPDVVISLKNLDNSTTVIYTTGDDGFYSFENVVPGNYKLSAATSMAGYEIGWESAWMVLGYLCGQVTLTPIQKLAADVNGSGTVKFNDLILIINHLLHGTPFPIGSWVFESYTFAITGTKDQPGGMSGASAGDLTGVFVPTSRALPAFPIDYNGEIAASNDEEFTISLSTYEQLNLTGAGLNFNYPSNLITIESVEFPSDGFQYAVVGDQLRLVWYGENDTPLSLQAGSPLATLHCRTTTAFAPGTKVNITLDETSSLAGANYTKVTGAKLGIPVITYTAPSLRLSNYPNPFVGSTTVNYYQPEDGNATIKVFSYGGQLVLNMPLSGATKGYHQVELDATRWLPGNYICQIQCDGSQKYSESRVIIKTN